MKKSFDRESRLRECQQAAKLNGGKFLSKEIRLARDSLKWQCREGHTWLAPWYNIAKGTWCQTCGGRKISESKRRPFKELEKLALGRGGKCLSNSFKNGKTKLQFICAEKHKFTLSVTELRGGTWCRQCTIRSIAKRGIERRLEKLTKLANARGGRVIGIDPINSTYALFECKCGYQWRTKASHIIYTKSWCPKCAGSAPLTMDDVKKAASLHRGQSLETEYHRSDSKMSWRCEHGHVFQKSMEVIKKGQWCAECSMLKRKLETTKRLAIQRSGRCLSDFYEGPEFHKRVALFECHKKHQWKMSHDRLKDRRWCPECAASFIGVR